MDIRIENYGSVVLLRPTSDEGAAWAEQHLPEDAMRWGYAYAIEPRYVQPIVDGLTADGLEVGA